MQNQYIFFPFQRCACVKAEKECSDDCKCALAKCKNRDLDGQDGPRKYPDSSVLSDMSNNDTAGTMSLLNDTYQIPANDTYQIPSLKVEHADEKNEVSKRKITPPNFTIPLSENTAPVKSPRKIFDTPDNEKSYKSSLASSSSKRTTMFTSPMRD